MESCANRDMARSKSPRRHVDSTPIPTDSMVTVSLSEADDVPLTPKITVEDRRLSSRPTSAEILQALREPRNSESSIETPQINSPTISLPDEETQNEGRLRSGSNGSEQVDWAELEKKEERELHMQEDRQDDEAMALLLARLEQENNALTSDPKSRLLKATRTRSQSRPPSLGQIKRLVQERDAADVRFSQLPSPPPMTELEFWAALVRDYPQTVQRLPTLTLNKIRGGIPAPLRGVVWQSASGARDKLIEDQYDSLCGESSPYENIINKDLGRSFPGVEMFKDPEGEGQKMLGRVLKCFSLYDHKIGYCQGLGFLVGPLLMQMGDKEAFCVLVRLMEDYDLRSCFLPDLSGLHLRIFQFQRLLEQHMPKVAAHLEALQIESAYLSQWFLSFFAVTCPLPMLFRIYDVVFAEGASETIMRVALAIMKRNEQRILGLSEMEDVMQLLLGRQLWDPYGRNAKSADELVSDFVSFTNDVTRESLQNLEAAFKESQDTSKEVQKSATSFLGRLWPISTASTKSVSLSPGLTAPSRPVSFLRRTPSKQSLASTLEGSESSNGSQSTAMTELSRGSSGDALSLKSGHESVAFSVRTGASAKDRDLHYQIEQLLMSVSQLQRQNTELEAALQKQREDRKEDHRIVRTAIIQLRVNKPSTSNLAAPTSKESRRRTTITGPVAILPSSPPPDRATFRETFASIDSELSSPPEPPTPTDDLSSVLENLDSRFPAEQTHSRSSSAFETKEHLKDSLARVRDQLSSETVRANALTRDLTDAHAQLHIARESLKETRHRLQESYNQNQKLEQTILDLRQTARKVSVPWAGGGAESPETPPATISRTNTADSASSPTTSTTTSTGLRELRLGRSASTHSRHSTNNRDTTPAPPPVPQFAKRTSSLATHSILSANEAIDNEALLLELVNAKTAEAVARQELEELRARFEGMKRAMGLSPGTPGGAAAHGRSTSVTPNATPPAAASTGGGVGGFFSGWKRSVSTSSAVTPQ